MTDTLFQLRYSDDGAANYGPWRDLDKGDTGAFLKPLVARRLGRTRHRVWEFRDTSPFVTDILACALQTNGEGVWRDFPLPDGSYADPSRPWTQQDVVNYLPTYAALQGARSRVKYHTAPGLQTFAGCGSGPHRGTRDVEGTLYTVSGTQLYRIDLDGSATPLGTIPGTGRVCMTHNQIDGGNQLVIGNRVSGYVWNTATETLTQISDDAFLGFAYCDFLGQYIVGVDQTRRFWYHSELNDALSYNSLDRYQAETSPDRITGILASHNQVLVFGERSIEPWENAPVGNAAGTAFQLSGGSVIERGCASGQTICRLDNSVFFLGDDGKVYRLNGYTPVPVSTQAQEASWSNLRWERAFAFTFEDAGHVVYYITFPDGQTWGYDVTSQRWHRRESYGLDRWRLNTLVKSNGYWYGGDSRDGQIHRLQWGYVFEAEDIAPRSIKSGVLHSDGNPVVVNALRVTADTGKESTPGDKAPSPIRHLAIFGDVPDGVIDDTVTTAYTSAFGVGAVTYAVTTGTFPAGLTLNPDGAVTGAFTTTGTYSWTVTGTDSLGNTATVDDTCTVTNPSIFDWREETMPVSQNCNCVFIDGDIIAVGHAYGGGVSYAPDRGYTWHNTQTNLAFIVNGLVKYNGDWYAFGQFGGSSYAAKATGDSFAFTSITAPADYPFKSNGAWVVGGYIYIAQANPATHISLTKFDGSAYSNVDTGITFRSAPTPEQVVCVRQAGTYWLLGTDQGRVLRTSDFITFTVVLTAASIANILGISRLAGNTYATNATTLYTSTDDGATFDGGVPTTNTVGQTFVMNNGYHHISAYGGSGGEIITSTDGSSGTWTVRFDMSTSPSSDNITAPGYSTVTLAAYPAASGYLYVGDAE